MNNSKANYRKGLILIPLAISTVLCLAIACTEPGQPTSIGRSGVQAPASTTSASSTAIYTSLPATPTDPLAWMYYSGTGTPPALLTQQAYEGAYATSDAQSLTRVAPTAAIIGLTYTAIAETPQYLRPTDTPEPPHPTITPQLGIFDCLVEYYSNNCWAGTVNGQPITVVAGRLRGDNVGSLEIFHSLEAQYSFGKIGGEYYPAPCALYSIGIASVNGSQITITPQDNYVRGTPTPAPTPVVLVFDLATREWISSTCGPLPEQTPVAPLFSILKLWLW